MTTRRHWMMTGAAMAVALGVGFGGAQLMQRSEVHSDEHADEEGHAEEGAFVELAASEAAAAGVAIVPVGRGGGSELVLPGRVEFAPGAEAHVDAPLAGTVIQVHVAAGSRVSQGSPLVTLRSPEGAGARAEVDAAAAAAEAASAAADRDRSLFERGFVARQRLDITEAEERRAAAELRAARARLGAYGGPTESGVVVVRSPTAGVVTGLLTALGSVLHEEALSVATVADATRVELVFEVPPGTSGGIAVGDVLSGDTADGQTVSGVVTAIAPANENGVATVRARPNGFTPPPGAVFSARIRTSEGSGVLVVPSEAVQSLEGVATVFVVEGDGFRARPVVTGRTAGGQTEILSGLDGSERIAGRGAFLLKSELAGGSTEHAH